MKNKLLKTIYMLSQYFLYGFILQLLVLNFGLPINAKGQYKRIERVTVNLSQKDLSIEQFFKEVQAQTPFVFSFDSKKIDKADKLEFKENQGTLEGLLIEASLQSNLSFRQINHSIDVKPKENNGPAVTRADEQVVVTGKVTDANGDPLPGVTISIPGTTVGTATDLDGLYSLSVPEGSTLVFSFIGFETQNISIGDRSVIDVVLREDMASLDEVVVVGYGTQRRSDVTTAVSSVSAENLQNRPSLNFGEAIAGQMAGVQVQQISGAPGGEGLSIRVRGVGSITQSNDPLYVVDGYPMEGNAFRLLNNSDIESIQVLKDASSTAIYGSRGA